MTTIAGMVGEGWVTMVCDSLFHDEDYQYESSVPVKIIRFTDWMVGVAGSVRILQLIQFHSFPEYIKGSDPVEFLVTEFIPELKELLDDNDYLATSEHGESCMNAELLIGFRGSLFRINKHFSVLSSIHPYDAAGSGELIALGGLGIYHSQNGYQENESLKKMSKQSLYTVMLGCRKHDMFTGGKARYFEINNDYFEVDSDE